MSKKVSRAEQSLQQRLATLNKQYETERAIADRTYCVIVEMEGLLADMQTKAEQRKRSRKAKTLGDQIGASGLPET
jgi:hypothetical protein